PGWTGANFRPRAPCIEAHCRVETLAIPSRSTAQGDRSPRALWGGTSADRFARLVALSEERKARMFAAWYDFNWIPDFMKTNWFLGLMVLLLLVFIGVM